MRLQSKKSRVLAVATAFASLATVGLVSSANADLGTGNTLTPNTGVNTPTTAMALGVTAPSNACQGDSATGGYRWSMYVAAGSVDPGTLTIAAGAISAPGGAYASALFTPTGTPQVNRNTAAATGQIVGTLAVNLETSAIPGNGAYNVGFICTLAGATTRHWISPITVSNWTSPTAFNWSFGAAPAAPAATAVGGDGVITGTISAVTATPAVTGYTVTATRISGTADASSPRVINVPAAGPFSLPAINGAVYTVTVTATNPAGTGPATTITPVNVNFAPVSPAPVVSAPNGPSPVTLAFTASAGIPPVGVTLVDHTITVTPVGGAAPIAGSPFTVTGATGSVVISGAPGSSYTYTVVGNYSDGRQSLVASGTVSLTSAQLVVQDLQVVRPVGALVLTQKCGVFGSAAAYSDTTFGAMPVLAASPAGADPVGPDAPAAAGAGPLNDSAPANPNAGLGAVDSLFPQYPYPVDPVTGDSVATYPTNCGIDLGIGRLVTSGPRAGQYFAASGRLAQLTVVNTRDGDTGWTLNGRMSDFTSTTDATDTFSGNLLGWNPEVTWDSNPNLDGYDMTVTAGGVRQPEASSSLTGLGSAANSTNTALSSSLAQATPAASLGMAVMDARLRLLIPVTADAGTYRGVLTFTTV